MNEKDFLANLMNDNADLEPVLQLFEAVLSIDDASLDKISTEVIKGMIEGMFTEQISNQVVAQVVKELQNSGISPQEAREKKREILAEFRNLIESLQPSAQKEKILMSYVNKIDDLYEKALNKYSGISIILPITLDEGAQTPTYAHETDACADLYAADDVILEPHTLSNMVRTGVHIALPIGWVAMIFPRSSIGAKTGLRLSNSAGIIDSEYRGPLGVIYDNTSDSKYVIHKGDRIAQLMVMPSYHFMPKIVDELPSTERGEGGFGSSGK